VVPRIWPQEHAYIFQNHDRRIVFAIPYEGDFTLIGTTDEPFDGDPGDVRISDSETDYLCRAANEYLRAPITPAAVVSAYSGVRPLYEDSASSNATVTRDYVFALDGEGPPLLSVYGGKITTYRRLAEHALARLSRHLPMSAPWTARAPLPGGDFVDPANLVAEARMRWPWLPDPILARWIVSYGTRMQRLLGESMCLDDLGHHFGGGLYEAEVRYLMADEFATRAADILHRRTRLGLHLPDDAEGKLDAWIARESQRASPRK